MTTDAEPLHFECVCCHAHADSKHTPVEHVLVILIMLERGELEGYKENLCFEHRRRLDIALEAAQRDDASKRR